jgi:hypothetical protein
MAPSTLVVACGAIARELALLRRLGWSHLALDCLPAELHNRPERIPEAVRARLEAARGRYRHVFVAYADCGTGGRLDRVLDEFGARRLPGAHCYEFLTGAEAFARLAEEEPGTFYLTDFLVRHFDRLVLEGLGLERHPELLPQYFGNYRRAVHLAQCDSTALEARARRCAARLGLAYRRVHTGLGPLAAAMRPAAEGGASCPG